MIAKVSYDFLKIQNIPKISLQTFLKLKYGKVGMHNAFKDKVDWILKEVKRIV